MDRLGIRSFLLGDGDVHVETLILQAFAERRSIALGVVAELPDGVPVLGLVASHVDQVVLPLLPRETFPDDESRVAYLAYMQDQLRERLEEHC